MAIHELKLDNNLITGWFSIETTPVIKIRSGDILRTQVPDAGWGWMDPVSGEHIKPFDRPQGTGHALIGPVYIEEARKGMTLEVSIKSLTHGTYGFTAAGHWPNWQNKKLELLNYEEIILNWELSQRKKENAG